MSEKRKAKETPENKALVFSALSYDPLTGEFRWKKSRRNGHGVGTVAGCLHRSGYFLISVDRIKFPSQRLAWLFHTGEWPKEHIDHINMEKSDNPIPAGFCRPAELHQLIQAKRFMINQRRKKNDDFCIQVFAAYLPDGSKKDMEKNSLPAEAE